MLDPHEVVDCDCGCSIPDDGSVTVAEINEALYLGRMMHLPVCWKGEDE